MPILIRVCCNIIGSVHACAQNWFFFSIFHVCSIQAELPVYWLLFHLLTDFGLHVFRRLSLRNIETATASQKMFEVHFTAVHVTCHLFSVACSVVDNSISTFSTSPSGSATESETFQIQNT